MDEKQAMTLQIQQLGFVLVDLNLYLDTHPADKMALMSYNTFQKQYEQMMMNYNMKYGPLMNFGHANGGEEFFQWVQSPWPWQKDANPTLGR